MDCPELVTPSLLLRGLEPGSLSPAYVEWLNDPVINRFLEVRHSPQTPESVSAYVSEMNASDHSYLFGIFLKSNRRHIGNIKLGPVDRQNRRAAIGWMLGDKAYWGKGYINEACRAVQDFAFNSLNLRKICGGVYAPNVFSAKILKREGFREVGRQRDHWRLEDDFVDARLFECLADDWLERRVSDARAVGDEPLGRGGGIVGPGTVVRTSFSPDVVDA